MARTRNNCVCAKCKVCRALGEGEREGERERRSESPTCELHSNIPSCYREGEVTAGSWESVTALLGPWERERERIGRGRVSGSGGKGEWRRGRKGGEGERKNKNRER